jgi:hypothetical protein
MKIELLTRDDFLAIESKLDELNALFKKQGISGSNKIYTTQQLAEKLSVSTKTIQTWREERLIEFSQISNKIFYTEQNLIEFLANHSIKRRQSFR